MADLELGDIQGNVVHGYSLPHAVHRFVEIERAAAGRDLLRKLEPLLTPGTHWGSLKPPSTLNLAISYAGLKALATKKEVLDEFPEEFRQGMLARATLLGDAPTGDDPNGTLPRAKWDDFWLKGEPDVWLSVYAPDPGALSVAEEKLESLVKSIAGVSLITYQDRGDVIPGASKQRFEHFGFADGISNPRVTGGESMGRHRDGAASWDRPTAAGEFILGYRDELDEIAQKPRLELGRNGTFVVYRKLKQDVAAFRKYVERTAAAHKVKPEFVKARIVGRFPDGTPLTPNGSRGPAAPGNAFDFSDDPDGAGCPLGAHIRRGNPRNSNFNSDFVVRHRLLRRGMAYGPPLGSNGTGDAERGLLFIAMNASILRQYEFVQRSWMNDGSAQGQGRDPDPLVYPHDGSTKLVVQGDQDTQRLPVVYGGLARFVESRGGGYFFMPGRKAVQQLAAGTFADDKAFAEDKAKAPEPAERSITR